MTQSTDRVRIKNMTSRNIQIMERLILGERVSQIAREFQMSPVRISIIVNSPLFKIELRKRLIKNGQKITDLRDQVIDGALEGVKFQKEVIGNTGGVFPIDARLRAASSLTALGLRIVERASPQSPQPLPEEGRSYEERLREVIFRDTTRRIPLDDGNGNDSIETLPSQIEDIPVDQLNAALTETHPPDDIIEVENQSVEDEYERLIIKEASG